MFCHCTVVFSNVNLQYLLYCVPSHDETTVKAATGWRIQLEGKQSKWNAASLPGNRKRLCKALLQSFVFTFGSAVFLLSLAPDSFFSHQLSESVASFPCNLWHLALVEVVPPFSRTLSVFWWLLLLHHDLLPEKVFWDCVEIFLYFRKKQTNRLYMIFFFLCTAKVLHRP